MKSTGVAVLDEPTLSLDILNQAFTLLDGYRSSPHHRGRDAPGEEIRITDLVSCIAGDRPGPAWRRSKAL
jgi:hypothetical protein